MHWWIQGRRIPSLCASLMLVVLTACGGGGGGGSVPDPGPGGAGVGNGGGNGAGVAETSPPPGPPTAYVLDSLIVPAAQTAASARGVAVASVAVRPKAVDLALPQWNDAPLPVMPMPGVPMQIGAPRALSSLQSAGDMARTLRWAGAPDGGQVAAISITSTGAHGLRLGLVVDAMPDAAELRLYRKDRSKTGFETTGKAINEAIARNRRADGDTRAAGIWWTPDLGADEVTLEIALPAGLSTSQLRIAIPTLTHAYVNLALPVELELRDSLVPRNVGDAAGCELDASCADQYAVERNAVARMTYVGPDNRYYYCTGSLLNNTKRDYTPYFLSASHCISTQAAATSLRTDWFFRSASCNSFEPNASTLALQRGATLLYSTAVTDATLMRLNEVPPAGATLAGWDARGTAVTGTAIYGLHHPQGDLLKYSEGQVQRYRNCSLGAGSITCSPGNAQSDFVNVGWSKGVTEGGSSGSAMFAGGRVVGTLSGGSSSCTVSGGSDVYSRFDRTFSSQIGNWLAQ
ncbi:S1 family peptidase [Comamonas thiooxydans]|uniref:S1 family peptidase n=1 Tax=Comamonas thiooxydans TaxID=363952 RepID=A0AA42PZN2_9BURK|nr:trypsin-like serine protease [Comamonas thiooxydans]MDH1333141.1 S1 family peptidase [Comamonas thiooxydans]MDH1739086.1 S1 family peptidase [Comamonas thiooxydans]MDH1786011.1 S1 family peptidase [Comamonas thiooxydans]